MSVILSCQGIWATFIYRVSHWAVTRPHVPVLSRCLRLCAAIASKIMEIVTGICLAYNSEIEEGLHIIHFGTIIVGSKVKVGRNCTISHGVTIGGGGHGKGRGVPTIGERVFIGPNAVIVGKITIGDDVMIGAGCVVSRSIPSRAVVIGNPCRIVWYEGSFEAILYDGMENDAKRNASLATVRISPAVSKAQPPPDIPCHKMKSEL